MKQLQEEYGPEKLRVVFKHYPLPFHPEARPAAEWAQGVKATAGDAAFWQFHDSAFGAQDQLGPSSYKTWAQRAGANGTALEAGVAARSWSKKVDGDETVARRPPKPPSAGAGKSDPSTVSTGRVVSSILLQVEQIHKMLRIIADGLARHFGAQLRMAEIDHARIIVGHAIHGARSQAHDQPHEAFFAPQARIPEMGL